MAHQLTNNTAGLEELLAKAQALPTALNTSDATAVADDIVAGETAYVNGIKLTGTNPQEKVATDTEVATQATQIEEIMELLEGKAVSGGGASVETCTVNISGLSTVSRWLAYTRLVNGKCTVCEIDAKDKASCTLNDVVCDSLIIVHFYNGAGVLCWKYSEDINYLYGDLISGEHFSFFSCGVPGTTATITLGLPDDYE